MNINLSSKKNFSTIHFHKEKTNCLNLSNRRILVAVKYHRRLGLLTVRVTVDVNRVYTLYRLSIIYNSVEGDSVY